MEISFYIAAAIAVFATFMVITRRHPVHALLYLIVSLMAVAIDFYVLGAPFVAVLEVIIYAGAIIVLFIFVVMMLNIGPGNHNQEARWTRPRVWYGPVTLALVLLAQLAHILTQGPASFIWNPMISPKQVAIVLYGPYVIGVELASMLLLAGLIGAYHLGRRISPSNDLPPSTPRKIETRNV